MNNKIAAFIFARGGSKGVPNKNLRQVGGKSLIAWSIGVAKEVAGSNVWVSTDSLAIKAEAESMGVRAIHRAKALCTDESPEWDSWQHAIETLFAQGISFDVFVSVPPTAPLRAVSDVNRAIQKLNDDVDAVVTMTNPVGIPGFNLVKPGLGGTLSLVPGTNLVSRRQDSPKYYAMTTVAYVSRPGFVLGNSSIWDGRVRGVLVPPERALDIDNEWDLYVADLVLSNESKGFR